jgi:hypothetical protein
MSNIAPSTTATNAPDAWLCLAGAAFCKVGDGLVEVDDPV